MSDALRILAVTLRYPPYVAGGYELLTRDAVEALRARGHHVTVLSGRGARFDGAADHVAALSPELDGDDDLFERSFRGANARRFALHVFSYANYRATRKAIARARPDVVLFFNLGLASLAPVVAARLSGLPTLGYVSDPWPANHWITAWREQGTKAARLALVERFWNGFRDLVGLGPLFYCSDELRRRVVASGVRREGGEVLHLGVPPDVAERAASAMLAPRAEGEALRVVCLSSFWEGKGQDVLLEACALAVAGGADLELALAGSGTGAFRDALAERAARADLAGRVHFLDLDRDGVAELLARSHVFVLPSVWGEPFALSTLEGMAFGLAVIVSDSGGSPEALEHGVEGLIVPAGEAQPLADALRRLDADDAMRRRLGEAAREKARTERSHAAFVDRLEARLRELAR